jgi:DoxX
MMQSSPFSLRRAAILLGRLFLGATFVYAAYSKILHPTFILHPWFAFKFAVTLNLANFASEVETFKVLSATGSAFVAHTLPFVELALGLLLLIGWRVRFWLAGVSLLLLAFLSILTRAYLLHLDIKNCGCFATPEPLTGMTLVRDGLFVAVALLCTYFAFVEAGKPHPWTAPSNT